MSYLRSQFLIAVLGFIAGFFACIFWQGVLPFHFNWSFNKKSQQQLHNPNSIPGFGEDDPFAQMQKLRNQAMQQMLNGDDQLNDDSADMDLSVGAQMSQREDDHFVYLDLEIAGLANENLNVEVKDNQVTVKGFMQKNDGGAQIQRSFHEQFPVPYGVDVNRVEIEQKQNKVILKFPKNP